MLCPLPRQKFNGFMPTECAEDACAWWSCKYKECCMQTIAKGVSSLHIRKEDKMTEEEECENYEKV